MSPAHPAGHAGGNPRSHPGGRPAIFSNLDKDPIVIFWELTLACALACQHCRAKAQPKRHPSELDTQQCLRVMDNLASFDTPPIVVLSGGDPFMRRDLFDIAEYGIKLGLTVSVSPSATALVTPERLKRLVDIGVKRVSFSLDSASAAVHDEFRGFAGTFDRTLRAFEYANQAGLSFQVNTTVARSTRAGLPAMAKAVADHGAAMWDLFFLVPTGRALQDQLLSADEHEEVYDWIIANARSWPFRTKTTLGQPYRRKFVQQRLLREGKNISDLSHADINKNWPGPPTNDGRGIFFISHLGDVYPSGFLPLETGSVLTDDLVDLYRNSPTFRTLRDPSALTGKCGECPFNQICGGSRARAYALTGDITAADPTCAFQPRQATRAA